MAILAIDTSTKFAELAILSEGEICSLIAESPNSHIEKLAELFRELLVKAKLETSSIEKIVLGQGPGSFTGLRIGYAFASGVASGLKIPIEEACSFAAVAKSSQSKLVIVLADAGRKELFAGIFIDGQVYLEPKIILSSELLLLLDQVLREKKISHEDVEIYSNLELDQEWEDYLQAPLAKIANSLVKYSEIVSMDFKFVNLARLQPNYLRPVAALKISERNS